MSKALHVPEDNDISVSNVTGLEMYIQIEFQQNLYVDFEIFNQVWSKYFPFR